MGEELEWVVGGGVKGFIGGFIGGVGDWSWAVGVLFGGICRIVILG